MCITLWEYPMYRFRITRDRTITLDFQDLVWAIQHLWNAVGDDFNTCSDMPESLAGRILVSKGLQPGLFSFLDGDKDNFRQVNIVPQREVTRNNNGYYSPFRGVSYHVRDGKWIAQLNHQGKRVLYKRFGSEPEAVQAYEKTCLELGLLDRLEGVFKVD